MSILRSNLRHGLLSLLIALVTPQLFGQNSPAPAQARSEQCVSVLKSGASQKEKIDACRDLALVGTPEAITVLAGLLSDEQLSHMARYALEPIPSPLVDDAFRKALGELKGKTLVGVIGSVGVRRDAKALAPLTAFLSSPEPDIAQGAARALGFIGTAEAARSIRTALPQAAPTNRLAFFEGLFRCAERLAASGNRQEALLIYDQLRGTDAPHQVRAGALIQAILARQGEGAPLLRESLHHEDYVLFAAAIKASQSLSGADVSGALTNELANTTDDRRIMILDALGFRRDTIAVPAIRHWTQTGSKRVRLAALKSLSEIGAPEAIPVFTTCLKDSDPDIVQTAHESLASLPGQGVEAAITAMTGSSEAESRLTGIELVGRRRMTAALPMLLKATQDSSPKVRASAFKRLGDLGSANELSPLLSQLATLETAPELEAAEQALTAIYNQLDLTQPAHKGASDQFMTQIQNSLGNAPAPRKCALIRLMSLSESAQSLRTIREAIKDPSTEVRATAIRSLSKWKTPEVSLDLLSVAKTASQPTERTLGLRGYLAIAANTDLPVNQRLAMCKEALPLIQRDEEKKLLLAALGTIPTIEALTLAAPYIETEATREEACSAVVAVADKLLKEKDASATASQLVSPLQKVAGAIVNAELARQAKALLQQAQSKTSQ